MTHITADQALPNEAKGAAIALGNFDGVHAGHQAVLAATREAALKRGVSTGAGVFTPHPRRIFQPDAPPFRIQNDAQRARALAAAGADYVFDIRFDQDVAKMSDRDFTEIVLANRLGARHVSIGAGFRFGRGRTGDANSLATLGAQFGFSVTALDELGNSEGVTTSSTAIRNAIRGGDMAGARDMLGRPWAIEGVVQKGFQRGRAFGYATANVALGEYVQPKLGVYAVRVALQGVMAPGVASIGVNPTVGALPAPLLETHLFDFDAELYGRSIETQIIAFLRPEVKFDSLDELKAQMARDAAQARAILGGQLAPPS